MKIAGKREKILMQWEGTWKKTVEILSSRLLTLSAEPTNLSNGSLRKRTFKEIYGKKQFKEIVIQFNICSFKNSLFHLLLNYGFPLWQY